MGPVIEMVPVTFPTGDVVKVLPHRQAAHGFERWEACMLPALKRECGPGSVLLDVGAEIGEFSVLAALGGAQVHLLEPVWKNWPGMRATWQANLDGPPAGCWQGFVADAVRDIARDDSQGFPRPGNTWPDAADGDILIDQHFGAYLEHKHVPAIMIDGYCARTGAKPTVILVDTEGAEGLVVTGARETILTHRPVVFLSIHPWLYYSDRYGCHQEHLFRFFDEIGYRGRFLGADHEAHWRFAP